MAKNLEIFFSNRLEVLYQNLKASLFGPSTNPLMRRLVVVYGPAMKTWLMLRMAQDPELNVAMGMEFIYLSQAFESLLKISVGDTGRHLPSSLEMALAIEKELYEVVLNFNTLSYDEQQDWEPLINYLKLDPQQITPKIHLSRKVEKRIISLSQHLARIFQDYGRYACQMVTKWESPFCRGWQPYLWRKLYDKLTGWTYPSRALQQSGIPSSSFTLHFFSISFITASEFGFLNRLSEHIQLHYYLLSPCAVFWSDIRSDRETSYLQTYWQQRLGSFSPQVLMLEELLRDRNPLLANYGRLGREMASQIERSQAHTHAHYVLPQHVQTLNDEICIHEDLYFTDSEGTLSLLHALQADLLIMRNPQGHPPANLEEEQRSVQLHVAPSRRREVQILYHNLVGLMSRDPSLAPGDMIVMAPQIGDYSPYIQSIFGIENSQLDFQILDLGMQTQSEVVQGFLQLLELSESRWDSSQLLQLFEHASFQRRHQFTHGDYLVIREWVEQAGIRWGDDWLHRNDLLERRHCLQGMVDETTVGTWDYGLSRLLLGLTTVFDENSDATGEVLPCSTVDFSQGDLLGRWIALLHSLRDDLSPLHDRTHMTMNDWANYLNCLLENYFQPDFEDSQSLGEFEDLKSQFEILRNAARFFKETSFPFASVKIHLISLLQNRGITYREDHLQAVRFCSFMPLRSIPAKVIAILGLQEGAFPRTVNQSSLNLMLGQNEIDYCPLSTDYDRYLFLEAIHSAQDYLLLSYQGYGQNDSKELQPSLIVEELFSYLDKYYTICGEKVTQACIFKHPFDAFDERYFTKGKCFNNFSMNDYSAAKACYRTDKEPPHRFLSDFNCNNHPQLIGQEENCQIDIKNLAAVAKNPIKFHLNKVLEIYLQSEEDRQLKIEEELIVSSLDKYQIKHLAIKQPIEKILCRAEKEGKLPFGLFRTVAKKRLREEVEEIHELLKKHSIDPAHIFKIEFCTSCSGPIQIASDRWLLPPAVLNSDNGSKISIVGTLSNVTPNGLLVLSKGTLADAWKAWPQFLMYCYASKMLPQFNFQSQLILAHSSQPKKAFFEDPMPYLKQFINYYTLCVSNFSPLIPEWIPLILEADARGLQDKMRQLFSESFGSYLSHDLRWILNKQRLPNSETIISQWKTHAELLLSDLMKFWYPKKDKQAVED